MTEQTVNQARMKIAIPSLIVIVLLGGLFYSALDKPEQTLVPSQRVNKPIPPFTAEVLFEQREVNLSELKGDYYLLNFWGSWCPTCYQEHPYLMTLKQQGIKIIGVNYKDTEQGASKFLTQQGNPYAFSVFDPKGRLAIEMGITAAPETFLVSPEGNVLYHRVGDMNESIFKQAIKPLIEQGVL
ncbi:MAG: DsbE family thiol:disulfide interchange protein [Kangiellaceae bacterium]|jgi:cytochrome c biogenesis protein CcmG/thiol:disulfide interchange protein DsbE|nr:DsbE family thiol:disulfide interchange protein [Kangiellaceae bacterium]